MDRKKLSLILFILLGLVQIYIPGSVILDREQTLKIGKEYKFRCAPIDPYDPFRGKYVILNFANTNYTLNSSRDTFGELVYVTLGTDADGFAVPSEVSKDKPESTREYVSAKVGSIVSQENQMVMMLTYPFDRYYMEETKAPRAEQIYRESLMDSSRVAYALVSVHNGAAVLKDLIVDGKPINQLLQTVNGNSQE